MRLSGEGMLTKHVLGLIVLPVIYHTQPIKYLLLYNILFSGDFRQILPVITTGTRADEVNASLKRSYVWPHIPKWISRKAEARTGPKTNRQFTSLSLFHRTEQSLSQFRGKLLSAHQFPSHYCVSTTKLSLQIVATQIPQDVLLAEDSFMFGDQNLIHTP